MNRILIQVVLLMSLSALCFFVGWALGFNAGKKKGEQQFCDNFLKEEKP
jgi:hypothetical protein